MLKNDILNISKFLLRKNYRNYLLGAIHDCSINEENSPNGCVENNILILRRKETKVGTFSDYIVFLKGIELAIEQNRIPIIDRQSIHNVFLQPNSSINTWELFFEQPLLLGLNDIQYDSMHVSSFNCGMGLFPVSLLHCKDDEVISYWRNLAKKYIRFNKTTEKYIFDAYINTMHNDNYLGVSVREGYSKLVEMKESVIGGHPIQLDNTKLISLVEKKMKEWNLDHVFFTCQTIDTVNLFDKAFGKQAICFNRERPEYRFLLEGRNLQKRSYEEAVKNERDYIAEMVLLSKCDSLICSHNSGSDAAFLMSKGYNNCLCIENDTY